MDYNFFEPYVKVKPRTNYILLGIFALFAFFVVGLSLLTAYEFFSLKQIKADIDSMTNEMQSAAFIEQLRVYDERIAELKTTEYESTAFSSFDKYTKLIHTGNENTVNNIANDLTDNMFLNGIAVNYSSIVIRGLALKKSVIGDFENNLRNSGNFSDVFVKTGVKVVATDPEAVKNTNLVDIKTVQSIGYEFEIECDIDLSKLLNSDSNEAGLWAKSIMNATGGVNH